MNFVRGWKWQWEFKKIFQKPWKKTQIAKKSYIYHFAISLPQREKCSYSEFFWSAFPPYSDWILRISPYSIQMRENMDQKNSNTDTFHAVFEFDFTGFTCENRLPSYNATLLKMRSCKINLVFYYMYIAKRMPSLVS